MPDRSEYEADLFRRYEARIVALELRQADVMAAIDAMKPIVDNLETDRKLHEAIAAQIVTSRSVRLSRLQIMLVILALFVPPLVSALTIHLLTRHS